MVKVKIPLINPCVIFNFNNVNRLTGDCLSILADWPIIDRPPKEIKNDAAINFICTEHEQEIK